MSQNPAELVAQIPEPEASSYNNIHDESQNFLNGPEPTDAWAALTAEKFHFQPNSMLAFYPRHVRKIVSRKKHSEPIQDI